MKTSKYKAYWHAWHELYLLYFLTAKEHAKRIEMIKATKPKHEIPIRLRLFQQVHGKISVVLIQAGMKWAEAHAKLNEAYTEWEEAYTEEAYVKLEEADAEWEEVHVKFLEAEAEYAKVYTKYLPLIEKLHTKECGCKEWNGKKLVLPEAGEMKK